MALTDKQRAEMWRLLNLSHSEVKLWNIGTDPTVNKAIMEDNKASEYCEKCGHTGVLNFDFYTRDCECKSSPKE